MHNFIYYYQHLPEYINPTAISLGFLRIDWYSIMYLVGFLVVYFLLKYRINNEEIFNFQFFPPQRDPDKAVAIFNEFSNQKLQIKKKAQNLLLDLLTYSFFGLVLGARIGYVLFYNFSYYLSNPLAIISPYDSSTHQFVGIYGMSYHGGLLGVILFVWIFSRKNKLNFFALANFVVPAIPAGYFFGRIGNFLNGELYGRVTQKFWGMYFPADPLGLLRHPSQLYEAFLEGIVLFTMLWFWRNRKELENKFLGIYIFGYALFRIAVEFFRQPDEQVGYVFNFLTLGQILSLIMLGVGACIILLGQKSKKCYNNLNGKIQETKIN